MKNKLISVALITVLLCMFLGNSTACGPANKFVLTINSTDGGAVTTPGEGPFSYDPGTVVNLEATPDASYHFVNWTGNVSTIANVNAATTTITMNDDYTITAHFACDLTFINNVPDINQPPTQTLPTTASELNYCAPIAMANILYYWDVVMGHANATGVTDDFPLSAANTTAEYLGYFMDTNNEGSPDRGNDDDKHSGTYGKDIGPGTMDFVRWDATHPLPVVADANAPALPTGKLGYDWTVTSNYFADADYDLSVAFYTAEIDAGRPLVVSFRYWNPVPTGISYYDPETGETIDICVWGQEVQNSWEDSSGGNATNPNPYEEWNWRYVGDNKENSIGHAVTGVGYAFVWTAEGLGPFLEVIVHDNWDPTPKNIAIPWNHWNSCHAVDPSS